MLRLCVCILALVTEHIQNVFSTQRYIVIWGVSWLYHIFPHYRRKTARFREKRKPESAFFYFLYNIRVEKKCHSKRNWATYRNKYT